MLQKLLKRRFSQLAYDMQYVGNVRGIFALETRYVFGKNKTEYLSRGSAILMEKTNTKTGKKMAGFASSTHIVYPFLTPYNFPNDTWLKDAKRENCKFWVSLHSPTEMVWEMELEKDILKLHDFLDVCLFQIPSSEADWFVAELSKFSTKSLTKSEPFTYDEEPFPAHGNVSCVGFDFAKDTDSDKMPVNRLKIVPGRILSSSIEPAIRRKVGTDGNILVQADEFRLETEEKLRFGMCGGPVVVHHDEKRLLGIIEGINEVNAQVHCLPAKVMWDLFDETV